MQGSMAAAMNVSQTPPSFCNCARRAASKIAEVFGHFFCARIRKPFKYSDRMPTSRPSEHFFFAKLSPKFIHTIWRCLALSSCPRRLWTARYKTIPALIFGIFSKNNYVLRIWQGGARSRLWAFCIHFESVGNFLLFESTFLTQKQATFHACRPDPVNNCLAVSDTGRVG